VFGSQNAPIQGTYLSHAHRSLFEGNAEILLAGKHIGLQFMKLSDVGIHPYPLFGGSASNKGWIRLSNHSSVEPIASVDAMLAPICFPAGNCRSPVYFHHVAVVWMHSIQPACARSLFNRLTGESTPRGSIGESSFRIGDPVDLASCLRQSAETGFALAE
jgi:hypothetical protein